MDAPTPRRAGPGRAAATAVGLALALAACAPNNPIPQPSGGGASIAAAPTAASPADVAQPSAVASAGSPSAISTPSAGSIPAPSGTGAGTPAPASSASEPPPTAAPSTGPVSGATAPPTAAPPTAGAPQTPTPPPAGTALCATRHAACALDPGTYTTAPSKAPFTFDLGDGWQNDLLDPAGGEIVSAMGTSIFWIVDPLAGDGQGSTRRIGTTAGAVVDYLAHLAGGAASEPQATTVGGQPATRIDLRPTKHTAAVLVSGPISFGVRPGTASRFLVVERGSQVAVLIVTTDSAGALDEVVTEIQPILDGIRWG